MTRHLARFLVPVAALVAVSCGGDDLTLPNEGQPADIRVVRGNGQNGTIGEPLADSLVVVVVDRFGNPVPGIEVTWTAEDGGAVDPAVDTTGPDGRAGTRRTLGAQPGTYTTIAAAAALPDSPVIFTTTAVAARLSLATQPSPSAAVGQEFERQPVIQLLNESGNPIDRAGVVVTVQIATGGGTLDGTTSRPSDAAGAVAFTDLAIRGSPGVRTLIFAADGFASATSGPIAIGVGAAASMELVEGTDQTATVNTNVPVSPAVVVRDLDGNPVPGVPVVFSVTAGAGSVNGGRPVTDGEGIARVVGWRLGTAVGENRLSARVEGAELAGSPVEFTATATAGPVSAAASTVEAAPGSITATAGSGGSTITVTARDEFGNPVSGRSVTLATGGTGSALTQPAQPTDESGRATGRFTATLAGPHTVSAQIDGVSLQATATVTVNAAAPVAGNSSATVGNGVAGTATPVAIQLQDQFGNPVTGQASKVAAGVTGANTLNVVGQTEEQGGGAYVLRYTPTAAGVDRIQVRVDGAALGEALTSTVAPAAADPATSTAQLPSTWRVFSNPGQIPVRVTVRDAFGNVRAGLTDEVKVQVDGGSPITAANNGDGTYSASFAPPRLGQVPVAITLNGQPIAGSPFVVNVTFF